MGIDWGCCIMMSHFGIPAGQITYVPSWQVIHTTTENLTVNQTFSVPSGADVRFTYNTPLDGQTLTTATTTGAYHPASFEEWDYIDEGTSVFIFGSITFARTNATTVTVSQLLDYGEPNGYWNPSFLSMEAFY
jgi:hypothetical protein